MRRVKMPAILASAAASGVALGLWLASTSSVRCPAWFGICFSEQRLANWQSALIGLLTAVALLSCANVFASRFLQRT